MSNVNVEAEMRNAGYGDRDVQLRPGETPAEHLKRLHRLVAINNVQHFYTSFSPEFRAWFVDFGAFA